MPERNAPARRTPRAGLEGVLGVALSLAMVTLLALSVASPASAECASEPPLRVGPPDFGRDGTSTLNETTIPYLAILRPAGHDAAIESTLWSLEASVQQFQLTEDGTLRVVLADTLDPSKTIVASFPDPDCVSPTAPSVGELLQGARDALAGVCGNLKLAEPCGARARVSGFGYFDPDARDTLGGAAPNGFELGPVLAFEPINPTATGPTSSPQVGGPRPGSTPPAARAAPRLGPSGTTLSGVGSQDTLPFLVESGPFTVTWSATAPADEAVNFASFIKPLDTSDPSWVFVANVTLMPGVTQSASVSVPGRPVGVYYMSAIGASSWSVTITRPPSSALAVRNPGFTSAPPPPAMSLLPLLGTPSPGLSTPPTFTARPNPPIPPRRTITPRPTRTPRPRG